MNMFKNILNKILKPAITVASKPARFNKNQSVIERAVNILRAAGIEEDAEFANRVDRVVVALNAYAKIDGSNKVKKEAKPAAGKKDKIEKPTTVDSVTAPVTAKTEPKVKKTKTTNSKPKVVKLQVVASKKTVSKASNTITPPDASPSK